jgi:hypothetical protein
MSPRCVVAPSGGTLQLPIMYNSDAITLVAFADERADFGSVSECSSLVP